MLWLNMHVLFWITLIPFPILMVGDHPRVPLASMCLGFVLLMCSLAAYMVRRYSYFKARLVDESLSETSIQDGLVQNIIAICLALAGIITALFSVYISYWIYVLVLAMFVIPQKLEKKTHHP